MLTREQKLKLVWKNTHNDFRGKIDGRKTVLVYRNGTTLVFLDSLTDEEINDRLPREFRD